MTTLPLYPYSKACDRLVKLADKWNLKVREPLASDRYAFTFEEERLQIIKCSDLKFGGVYVDFTEGAIDYRRKHGGGRSEPLAKTLGFKKGICPSVIDATAGFGKDSFLMASLGCRVHMIERNLVIGPLLEDGVLRAKEDVKLSKKIAPLLTLSVANSIDLFENLPFDADVIYLDPMYPKRQKSSLVKKEMQVLQDIVGQDQDVVDLFKAALMHAKNRVVVKMPLHAKNIIERNPDTIIKTKNHRFDIYIV